MKKGFEAALKECAVAACKASEAHVQMFMFDNNYKAIQKYFENDLEITNVMTRLLMLHGLQLISEDAGAYIGMKIMTLQLFADVDDRIGTLMNEIRPDAVPLCDAFGFLDSQLNSTIGRYDGDVYTHIVEEARKNPLNQTTSMVGWDNFSKVLNLEFLKKTEKEQYQKKSAKL